MLPQSRIKNNTSAVADTRYLYDIPRRAVYFSLRGIRQGVLAAGAKATERFCKSVMGRRRSAIAHGGDAHIRCEERR